MKESKDNDSEYDGGFDFESFKEDLEDQDNVEWDINLDDEGNLIRNDTLPLRYKAMAVLLAAAYAVLQFVGTVIVLFLLIAAVSFLMGFFGVAIPVA